MCFYILKCGLSLGFTRDFLFCLCVNIKILWTKKSNRKKFIFYFNLKMPRQKKIRWNPYFPQGASELSHDQGLHMMQHTAESLHEVQLLRPNHGEPGEGGN